MAEKINQEKIQEKYMQFQAADQQIKQLHQQAQAVEQQLMEMTIAKEAIKELKETKVGKEILVPVTNGIFLKAELKDNENLILNVGASTAVTMDVDSTAKMLEDQVEEISKIQTQMQLQLKILVESTNQMKSELQTMMESAE